MGEEEEKNRENCNSNGHNNNVPIHPLELIQTHPLSPCTKTSVNTNKNGNVCFLTQWRWVMNV